MRKKNLLLISFSAVCILVALFFLHPYIFPLKEICIEGNEIVKKKYLQTLMPKKEMGLFEVNREDLAKKLKSLPYIESVRISRKLFTELLVEIKEKNLVAEIVFNKKKYYLSSKGLVITEKNYINNIKLPVISLKNKVTSSRLILLSAHLAVIKFHYKNFFNKISEISLDSKGKTDIFIKENQSLYILNSKPSLEDFLRLVFLSKQQLKHKVLDLRGNYILVKK